MLPTSDVSLLAVTDVQRRTSIQDLFPGRLWLTLGEACTAISLAKKTYHDLDHDRRPFPASKRPGSNLWLVHIDDLEAACAAIAPPLHDAPRRSMPAISRRSGRPTNKEREKARRKGLTVAQMRIFEAANTANKVQS